MRKTIYQQVRYYQDEVTDDFCQTKTNKEVYVDGTYQYLSSSYLFKALSFIVYYLFALPILFIYAYVFKGVRVYGRENLRQLNSGYIMYANHTHEIDAFLGHVMYARPKRTYIIANKDAISIKGLSLLVKGLGALPVPDTMNGLTNLNKAIASLLERKKAIMIYPEAKIWHYYTGLRPFPITSFRFAANNNVPAVPIAITYRRPKGLLKNYKKPRMTAYIGEPIHNKDDLNNKENARMLWEETVEFIETKVSDPGNVKLYEYVKKSD